MGRKLSDILKISLELDKIDHNSIFTNLNDYLSKINELTSNLTYVSTHETKEISSELKNLLEKYRANTLEISKNLKRIVHGDAEQYIKSSEDFWRDTFEKMTFQEHVEWAKLLPPNKEELSEFLAKILNYANWQCPGLIYGAKDSNILEFAKSSEPMYIMENYKEYFDKQREKYSPEFIRKLKFYTIQDINFLPKNDIGIIVVFNEFPFLPWTSIQFLLNKLTSFLMPGGILIFNYNNCATVEGFKAFEDKIMTYTTPGMYLNFLHKQNLNLLEHYVSTKDTFSYLIMQKDGNKKLIKKYPSIGYIKTQPTYGEESIHHKKRLELIRKLSNDE